MSATHKHHRKRRSQGGDDSYGNLIELPMQVHELVHANPEVAYQHGLLVRSYENPADIRPDIPGFLSTLGVEIEEKPKRKNYAKDSEERRKRKRITVAVPADREDGGALWDEYIDLMKKAVVARGLWDSEEKVPVYEALIAVIYDWLTNA